MNLLLNERVVVVELIIRLVIIIDTATGDHSLNSLDCVGWE